MSNKLRERYALLQDTTALNASIVISGFPRSGTTYLQSVLDMSGYFRAPRMWQIQGFDAADLGSHDRRVIRAKAISEARAMSLRTVSPELFAMHPLGAMLAEECTPWLAGSYLSAQFVWNFPSSGYLEALLSTSQDSTYALWASGASTLSQRLGPSPVAFKSPFHILGYPQLRKIGLAAIVHIRRALSEVATSNLNMLFETRRIYGNPDPVALGREWLTWMPRFIRAASVPETRRPRLLFVDFEQLIENPVRTAERFLADLGGVNLEAERSPLWEQARHFGAAASARQALRPLARFGISNPDLRRAFSDVETESWAIPEK